MAQGFVCVQACHAHTIIGLDFLAKTSRKGRQRNPKTLYDGSIEAALPHHAERHFFDYGTMVGYGGLRRSLE